MGEKKTGTTRSPIIPLRRMTKINRRKFFKRFGAGVIVGGAAISYSRLTGYAELPEWNGAILSKTEAQILISACEVILPPGLDAETYMQVAKNVDTYVNTFTESAVSDIHLLFAVVEHLTPISLQLSRFTNLNAQEKNDYLNKLDWIGWQLRQVYKGIRDLCLLGYYQQNSSWEKLKYGGPIVEQDRVMLQKYLKMQAKAGSLPNSIVTG